MKFPVYKVGIRMKFRIKKSYQLVQWKPEYPEKKHMQRKLRADYKY
jgi:hypothetical protein